MASCKDCVYVDICDFSAGLDEPVCGHFKDCARFIELPCKVGDEFFVLCESATIFKYKVSHINIFLCSVSICEITITLLCKEQKHSLSMSKDRFVFALGTTMFLTKKEAERALTKS